MGTFYSDDKIQEAIAALEDHTPGIWERMKKMASAPDDPHDKEQEAELGAIVRVLTIVLPRVSFVAQAEDKNEARARLSIDVGNTVRAAIAPAKDVPKPRP
ncbi:hypothetical protein FXV83_42065 [Bradyrhizobium hipponense]|uniref:Uncharacterized protein n=1 Tax=Bradyrhizobium hipponense TaxID=2605638 RepID=A0A5S4Y9M2_9BRAD|nr:hypothetical protein [Bradyrhizobium hipponense]TYO60763.1 hypothetical protein FXV83_42065 [Bradyrhizobium hipponense]